jgi:hypothetical protein
VGILERRDSVLMVNEYKRAVVNMYGVLKICGSVIEGCEYNESVVDLYGDK